MPDDFTVELPPVRVTTSGGGEFFGGFVAPPLVYPDGGRYLKAVGQILSTTDGEPVADQVSATVRAVRRLLPSLEPGDVHHAMCMTTDAKEGRPILDWVDSRVAVAIAGNGEG